MVELDIRGVQLCCLAIAKEFAKICENHNIPYYMLGGTMLGAIRHKGFIPWDDDMDFGVPYKYYDQLISLLKAELPEPYRCSTYKDSRCVFLPFFKIEDTSTILFDDSLSVSPKDRIGINIDIFPLIYSQNEISQYPAISHNMFMLVGIWANSRTHIMRNKLKTIIRLFWPFNKAYYNNKIISIINVITPGNCLSNILGRWGQKEFVPIEWYGEKCKFPFEDTFFVGIQEYDKYLTQLYGNYMNLPPVEQRFAHSVTAFQK